MKVLVRMNQGVDKSYLLQMKEGVTKAQIRRILDNCRGSQIPHQLFAKSTKLAEMVSRNDKQAAVLVADFVVDQSGGATAGRLA